MTVIPISGYLKNDNINFEKIHVLSGSLQRDKQ